MLVGYYLPGNSAAPPPGHRAGGGTAHEEVEQRHLTPSLLGSAREVQAMSFANFDDA